MNKPDFKNVLVCKEKLSPYWIAQWTDARGKRIRRSTKVPVGGGRFRGEHLSPTQAKQRALMVAFELAQAKANEHDSFYNTSVREVCDKMLAGKLGRVCLCSYVNACTDYKQFLGWLGKRADEPIRFIARAVMKEWIIARRAQVRAKTVRKALTSIRSAFEWAVDAEIIAENPCDKLKVTPDSKYEKVLHEAFTLKEVKFLIDKLPEEWSSAVRCCIGTYGQRISDILSLRWAQFNWVERIVTIITGKNARILHQPMQPAFYEWARTRYEAGLAARGDAAVYVHPTLRLNSHASNDFTRLVKMHGIGTAGCSTGGNRVRRHSKTFHSLRATVATMLHASGVSLGMAMELVGHDSAAVHAAYIHPTLEHLRAAVAKLPEI